jgi:hypothetical protein
MRVPQREISLRQFAETEFAPCEVLQKRVAAWMSKHARAPGKQKIGKHRQRHCQQEDQRNDCGTPVFHQAEMVAARTGKIKAVVNLEMNVDRNIADIAGPQVVLT